MTSGAFGLKKITFRLPISWSGWVPQTASFLLISVITLVVYGPSFHHYARADTFIYTAATAGYHTPAALIENFYSFNRVNFVNPGDKQLFRPIYFSVLGIEKGLFGYKFLYWQITCVLVHLLLVWCLLTLLLRIRPSIFAPIVTLFFSTLFIGQELVIWQILNPYIVALIFVVLGLNSAYRYVAYEARQTKWLILTFGCLVLAVFTYEATIAFSFIVAAYVLAGRTLISGRRSEQEAAKRRGAMEVALLVAPVAIYAAVNYWDSLRFRDMTFTGALSGFDLPRAGKFIIQLAAAYLYGGLFPRSQRIQLGDRLQWLPAFNIRDFIATSIQHWPTALLGQAAAFVGFCIVVRGAYQLITASDKMGPVEFRSEWNRRLIGSAALGLWGAVLTAIVIGRGLPRGLGYLWTCLHYPYLAWLFFIIFIYCFCDSIAIDGFPQWGKDLVKMIAGGTLIGLSFINAWQVYELNVEMERLLTPRRLFAEELNRFVRSYTGESDFSFNVLHHAPGDEYIPWIEIA